MILLRVLFVLLSFPAVWAADKAKGVDPRASLWDGLNWALRKDRR